MSILTLSRFIYRHCRLESWGSRRECFLVVRMSCVSRLEFSLLCSRTISLDTKR
jgi:hypothetical protein